MGWVGVGRDDEGERGGKGEMEWIREGRRSRAVSSIAVLRFVGWGSGCSGKGSGVRVEGVGFSVQRLLVCNRA